MGFVRSCYTTKARFYEGGPLSRIRWYFVPEDNPRYMGKSAFWPRSQELDYVNQGGAEELRYRGNGHWNDGEPPPGVQDGVWHGTEADFAGESPYPGPIADEDLPDCVRARLRECDLELQEEGGHVLHDDDGGREEAECLFSPCDLELQEEDGHVLHDDDGGREESECLPACSLELHEDDGHELHHEDGGREEAECP